VEGLRVRIEGITWLEAIVRTHDALILSAREPSRRERKLYEKK
jgi:uncharacterized DUF497 family protein